MSDQPTDPTTRIPLPGSMPPPAPPPAASSPSPTPPPAAAPPPLPPPAWPRARARDDGRAGSVVFGLIVLALGLWFFASETLGLAMPDIEWRQAWPVLLIAIGGWIVLGTLRRRS